jgi:hypothetical protein
MERSTSIVMDLRIFRCKRFFDRCVRRDYNDSRAQPLVTTRSVERVSSVRIGVVARSNRLPSGNGLWLSCREAFSAIVRNGAINNGPTIDALPCIKNEEKIREPLQHHQPFALRTFHHSLPRWICSQLSVYIARDAPSCYFVVFQ